MTSQDNLNVVPLNAELTSVGRPGTPKSGLRVMAGQLNLVVGDVTGNLAACLRALRAAEEAKVDLLVLPELALTGYPPEDLLLSEGFVGAQMQALYDLAQETRKVCVVVGFVDVVADTFVGDTQPRRVANAAAVLKNGSVQGIVHKTLLPNYGVFDEGRYFAPRTKPVEVFDVAGIRLGVAICEDLWQPNVADALRAAGAEVLAVVNASPYHQGKPQERLDLVRGTALRTGMPVAYVNMVGGQDQVVFDGGSLIVDGQGELVGRAPLWKEHLLCADLGLAKESSAGDLPEQVADWPATRTEEVYGALVTGLRDYVRKNGFQEVVLGLSGGIDSALVATLAVDALGADAVRGIGMPSPYSSGGSVSDARDLAERLKIRFDVVPINDMFGAYQAALDPVAPGTPGDVTEQNLQARIRGGILMAISNQSGALVLSTGNKSETAVGFCTLYGDMCGGLAVISDVPKTLVYNLCRWRNENIWDNGPARPIPVETIEKPPSAELAPDQVDTDSLPPYEVLDPILRMYVENGASIRTIQAAFEPALSPVIERIVRLVDRNEYKRRQAAPGVKITRRAFGRDRRIPITNAWRGSGTLADAGTSTSQHTEVVVSRRAVDEILAGSYDPHGIENWWSRPRTKLGGQTPNEVFDTEPDQVLRLAASNR